LRILLAEDNEVNQMMAINLLQKWGHQVEVAGNGREVLAALDRQHFDAVLMDVQMPEMDGFKATAAIRDKEQSSGQHLPIIAMTAHAIKGDRERCLAAGMDGYVSKPIQSAELFAALSVATGGPQSGVRDQGSGVRKQRSPEALWSNQNSLTSGLCPLTPDLCP